jgi:hypothetical protein
MTIHEEASLAFVGALADGCACYRCRDAGLRAALDAVALRLRRALDTCDLAESTVKPLLTLIGEMEYPAPTNERTTT